MNNVFINALIKVKITTIIQSWHLQSRVCAKVTCHTSTGESGGSKVAIFVRPVWSESVFCQRCWTQYFSHSKNLPEQKA